MFLLTPADSTYSTILNNASVKKPVVKSRTWFCLLSVSFFLLCFSATRAQPCTVAITNNSIQIKAATCINTVATLQGSTPLGGNGTYTYQWEKSVGNCGAGNFQAIAGATLRDYAVPQSTDPNDCFRRVVTSGTCVDNSNSTKVAELDRTTPAAPVTVAVQSSCAIATGLITVTTPAPGPGIFYSIDGLTYTNTTGLFSSLVPGTYSVTAKFLAGCISPVKTEIITPLIPVTGTISPATATICTGASQVLTVNGGTSYQWYKNGVAITGATASTYTATTAGTYTADIISGVCRGTASNSSVVTVSPLPAGNVTPVSATICAGSSVTLNVNGGVSYQWYKNNVLITGATGATYSATTAGTYSADIINSAGCKARATDDAVVTVTPLPTGSISPSSVALCTNGSILLTVSGGTSYQWYKNGVLISGATAASYSTTTAGSYTADIIAGNCKNTSSNAAVVTQASGAAGTITPTTSSICSGSSQVLTATGGGTYQWFKDDVLISGATSATYTATQPGTYNVNISNSTCSSSATAAAVITQGVPPSGFITPATASICPGKSVTLTAITASGGTTYQWFFNGTLINGANASVYTATQTGNYSVIFFNGACNGAALNIVSVTPSVLINFNAAVTGPTCTTATGSIAINNVTGGGGSNYSYSKDNGATFQASNAFAGLPVSTYQVVVKDTAGCISNPKPVVVAPFVSTLAATATKTDARCGGQNGAVTVQATGGAPGYTYSLDNGAYQTANTFINVTVGSHKVTVKDQGGCVFDVAFVIAQTGVAPNLLVASPINICPGFTVNLQAPSLTSGSDTGLVYSYWRDSAATMALTTPGSVGAGTYYVKGTTAAGCFVIKPVTVVLYTVVAGTITPTGPASICVGESFLLTASTGTSYRWYRNDTLILGANTAGYKATQSGLYTVFISNGTCFTRASDSIRLEVRDCPETKVFVPTAFTPNKNGVNDVLRPVFYSVGELHYFRIYNRWGQRVFETNIIGKGWDGAINGTPQPTETYSWMLECVTKNGDIIKQSGRSLLIR